MSIKQNTEFIIISLGIENSLGGLEIFNSIMEKELLRQQIGFYRVPNKIFKHRPRSFPAYLERAMTCLLINRRKYQVLMQYGNIYDILLLPFISLFSRKTFCIAHCGAMSKHLTNPFLNRLSQWILNYFCHCLLCISDIQMETFHKITQKKKISSLIAAEFFTEKFAGTQKNYYLYLGRLAPVKGIDLLIAVFANLFAGTEIKLLIGGEFSRADFKHKITSLISEKNIGQQVVFLGKITDPRQKIRLIDEAIALLYPSKYDALPLVPIESFARKKICLCSDIAEAKSFIAWDEFLFNPYDQAEFENKLSALHANINHFSKAINHVHEKTQQYHPSQMIDQLRAAGLIKND